MKSLCSQCVKQDVSGAVQEESELIGFKSMARSSIGVKEGFVIFDKAFRASSGTVNTIVDKLSSTAL